MSEATGESSADDNQSAGPVDGGAAGGSTGGNVPAVGAGTTSVETPWHGIEDEAVSAYIANKGWKAPADVIKSYQGAEKLLGKNPDQLLIMPRADDPAGLRELQTRLGLPETADKYEFDTPKDLQQDQAYVAWAKDTFHKLGLTSEQVKALSAEHNNYVRGTYERQAADYDLNLKADQEALLKEWRGGHERMMNAAKTAAGNLGFSEDVIDAIENKIGYAETMKLFAGLGTKMGEDSFVGNGDQGPRAFSDSMTPTEATAQWEASKLDPNFQKALFDRQHPGHKAAAERQAKLFKIMYPEG